MRKLVVLAAAGAVFYAAGGQHAVTAAGQPLRRRYALRADYP